MLKFIPEWARIPSRHLFRWQDQGFDHWVGKNLRQCDAVHAMSGQCLHAFRRAKELGIRTVMNHATGPVREWVRIMEPEYRRVGLKLEEASPYDAAYFRRESHEYALADFHCVASTLVRDQLMARGISRTKIRVVPYGADERIFFPGLQGRTLEPFKIVFAGQIGLRKGLRTLLQALEIASRSDWQVDFYGPLLREARHDLEQYQGSVPLKFHGAVSQGRLAKAFRNSSVLVLGSLEEGFGLVVPQALNCGLPCIVSNRVGARDLIEHRVNGSIFECGNPQALLKELRFWQENLQQPSRSQPVKLHPWRQSAEELALPWP